MRNPYDLWYIKALFGAVLVFDTVHQMLISHAREFSFVPFWIFVGMDVDLEDELVYWYIITNYGRPLELGNFVWYAFLSFTDRVLLIGMEYLGVCWCVLHFSG
jgi:hypothetical protein